VAGSAILSDPRSGFVTTLKEDASAHDLPGNSFASAAGGSAFGPGLPGRGGIWGGRGALALAWAATWDARQPVGKTIRQDVAVHLPAKNRWGPTPTGSACGRTTGYWI